MQKRAQTAWLVALVLGAMTGVWGLIMPVTGIVLAVAATVVALLLPGPRRFGFGGVWLGFGGIWTFFLLRTTIDCVAGPTPSDACGGQLFQTYLVVGILMAVVGLFATITAFRGTRAA